MRLSEVYALAQALIEEVDTAQKRHHKVGSRAADLEVALKTALSARTRSERCALDAVAQLHAARVEHAASLEDLRKVRMQCPLSACPLCHRYNTPGYPCNKQYNFGCLRWNTD